MDSFLKIWRGRKRVSDPKKHRNVFRISALPLILALLAIGCQRQDTHLKDIEHLECTLKAKLRMVSTGAGISDEATLEWTAANNPNRWIIRKSDNNYEMGRDVIDGAQRQWVDKSMYAGHLYTYEILAEMDNQTSAEKKQALLEKISIASPDKQWREDRIKALLLQEGKLELWGLKFIAPLKWESTDISGMTQWVIEKKEEGAGRPTKELTRITPISGRHEFTDYDVDDTISLFYDFVAIGTSKSAEGHPIETRFIVKSIAVKNGTMYEFDWQRMGRAVRD
ncbi:MAG: hypothetical protein HY537_14300 [Deltaproteobacteria bacterium]|nr:hypothetical protein [Deltaproteobacteria bacterium]